MRSISVTNLVNSLTPGDVSNLFKARYLENKLDILRSIATKQLVGLCTLSITYGVLGYYLAKDALKEYVESEKSDEEIDEAEQAIQV